MEEPRTQADSFWSGIDQFSLYCKCSVCRIFLVSSDEVAFSKQLNNPGLILQCVGEPTVALSWPNNVEGYL